MTTTEIFQRRAVLNAEQSALLRAMHNKAGDMANAGRTSAQIDAVIADKMSRYEAIDAELRTLLPF